MSELRVLIIESSYPNDFYSEKLDGPLTHHLVKLLGIQSRLIYALDRRHFEKAIVHGAEDEFDLVHVSCHGDENGLALTDNAKIGWETFVKFFADSNYSPKALIMSSCCGGASELGDAFKAAASRPKIIFGSNRRAVLPRIRRGLGDIVQSISGEWRHARRGQGCAGSDLRRRSQELPLSSLGRRQRKIPALSWERAPIRSR